MSDIDIEVQELLAVMVGELGELGQHLDNLAKAYPKPVVAFIVKEAVARALSASK